MKVVRSLLLGLAIGAGGFWLGTTLLRHMPRPGPLPPGWGGPAAVAAMLVIFIAVIGVHEGGHVLGGRLAGFRFLLWIAGPVAVRRTGDGLRIEYNSSPALFGGVAASAPLDDRDLPRRMMRMVAGGPLASVVLAALAFAGAGVLDGWWRVAAIATGLFSATIAIATSIPLRSGQMHSDGARVVMLLRGGKSAEAWCANAAAMGMSMGGVRPRDLPEALAAKVEALADESYDGTGAYLILFRRAADRGDFLAARHWLERLEQGRQNWPAPFRALLDVEHSWLDAVEGNAAAARRRFDAIPQTPFVEKGSRLRVEAAVLAAEGRAAEAARVAVEARAALASSYDRGMAAAECDWLSTESRAPSS